MHLKLKWRWILLEIGTWNVLFAFFLLDLMMHTQIYSWFGAALEKSNHTYRREISSFFHLIKIKLISFAFQIELNSIQCIFLVLIFFELVEVLVDDVWWRYRQRSSYWHSGISLALINFGFLSYAVAVAYCVILTMFKCRKCIKYTQA